MVKCQAPVQVALFVSTSTDHKTPGLPLSLGQVDWTGPLEPGMGTRRSESIRLSVRPCYRDWLGVGPSCSKRQGLLSKKRLTPVSHAHALCCRRKTHWLLGKLRIPPICRIPGMKVDKFCDTCVVYLACCPYYYSQNNKFITSNSAECESRLSRLHLPWDKRIHESTER